MRKLPKPKNISETVFLDCISVVKSSELRARLTACKDLIAAAATEFDQKVTQGKLHTVAKEKLVTGNVTAKELGNVYSAQMVGNTVGRKYYDALIMTAPNNLCPLCSHRDVSTLDHYLPKAKYPRLAVVPINLIPSCADCNTGKLVSYPTAAGEETLHPYYDDIENDVWLKITVNKTTPASIKFFVDSPANWSSLLSDRVKFHFDSFDLKTLYATQAARELSAIRHQLNNICNSGAGASGVKAYLLQGAVSRSFDNKNSWQTALYTGLANDTWFCNEGFRLGI